MLYMNEKISLAGDLGSGKSTVSDILIKELGAEYYSTGAIVRSIAAKRGMSVVELNNEIRVLENKEKLEEERIIAELSVKISLHCLITVTFHAAKKLNSHFP